MKINWKLENKLFHILEKIILYGFFIIFMLLIISFFYSVFSGNFYSSNTHYSNCGKYDPDYGYPDDIDCQ